MKGTADLGITLHSNQDQGFRVYADADFAGNWLKEYAKFDLTTAKSRLGWLITYADCPILWASKLQSQVALSITEANFPSHYGM